ncbi:TlpA disulfide reductase family protein [Bacillus sp. V33-4]|uniref:TlpA disulfide reductase family protein n=1 Tax=Bacillus sp. V33-4 TaxID=2054169 RepID=UPI0027E442BA|nr:TlpA disulfide reductase family protein [Bacillus sp. V33-4]
MPHMQNFYEENKKDGVTILAVNLTDRDSGQKAIEDFVKDYNLTFPILLDENGEVGSDYQAVTIPTFYFIDSNGLISEKVIGAMDEGTMNTIVNKLK